MSEGYPPDREGSLSNYKNQELAFPSWSFAFKILGLFKI